MIPGGPRATSLLLTLYALLWPWDVYLYVPVLGVALDGLVGFALVLMALAETLAVRRLRVSFEVMLPAMAAMAAGLWLAATTEGLSAATVLRATVLLLAVAHLVPGPATARRLLALSAASMAGLAAFSLAARTMDIPRLLPTAFSLASGASAYGCDTAGAAAWALAVGGAVAARYAVRDRGSRWAIAAWGGAAILCLVECSCVIVPALDTPLLGLHPLSAPGLAAAAAVAWLLSRIAAKHVVAAQEEGRSEAVLFLAVLAATALAALWSATAYGPQAVLIALAAAAAKRHEEPLPQARGAYAAAMLLLPLVAYNALNVWPGNAGDPRNYAALAVRDLAREDYETLDTRMDYVQRVSPEERMTWLWRARAALDQDDPVRAATFLEAAVAPLIPGTYTVLLPPTDEDVGPVRTRLRDALSRQSGPPEHVAYERFLVAAGEVESAMNLLRGRLPDRLPNAETAHLHAFARALAFLLGDAPEAGQALEDWTAPELLAILEQVGARVERAALESPVLLCAAPEADSVAVLVEAGEHETVQRIPADLVSQRDDAAALTWLASEPDASGARAYCLDAAEPALARVVVPAHGAPETDDTNHPEPVHVRAGSPAVLLLLP